MPQHKQIIQGSEGFLLEFPLLTDHHVGSASLSLPVTPLSLSRPRTPGIRGPEADASLGSGTRDNVASPEPRQQPIRCRNWSWTTNQVPAQASIGIVLEEQQYATSTELFFSSDRSSGSSSVCLSVRL